MKFRQFINKHCGKLAFLWALVIFALCATPGRFVPSASWLEMLGFDKWVHAGIFFILCSLLFVMVARKRQTFYALSVWLLLAIIYGGALEIMQATLFSQRSADWQDFAANSFGCFVAFFLYRKIKKNFVPAE